MPPEAVLFLRQLITNPKRVSALAPSSRGLSRAMTAGLGPKDRVVEFGPGTGVITREILARGVLPGNLDLFEMSPDFARHLGSTFPGIRIHNTGAQDAARLVQTGISAVISGLPLLSMPSDMRRQIVEAAFAVLQPKGRYVQFTYGPRPPIDDDTIAALGLSVQKTAKIWLNLPPAQVYVFRRLAET